MSKPAKKPKVKQPKLADVFQILRDLRTGERIVQPPPTFSGEFRFSRSGACRSLKRYGVLRNGAFNIYLNRQQAEKNQLWRSVDLTQCRISYRLRDKRIMVELSDRYRLKVKKTQFQPWVDSLRAHRLHALTKAKEVSAPEPLPSPSAVSTSTPVQIVEPPTEKPEASVEKKATIPVPVTILPSQPQQESNVKKSSLQPKTAILSVSKTSKAEAQASVKSGQAAPPVPKTIGAPAKPIEKDQRPVKTPVPVTVEVFVREPEPTTGKMRMLPVTPPAPSPVQSTPEASQPMVNEPVVKEAAAQPSSVKECPKQPVQQSVVKTTLPGADSTAMAKKEEEPREASEDSAPSTEHSDQPASKAFRTSLPAPMNPAPSLFRLIMAAIGRDVMRMALPASVMEPLSTLQVLCEELENAELIERALAQSDPVWRMLYVAALAMSRYGSTAKRAGRKPFNPLLAETFEFVHPTAGWHFLAEQVSHHPPVSACYAEGKGWRISQDCELVASLSTTAVKATPLGLIRLHFEKLGETYVWNKVLSQVTGILRGNYVIDHIGEMTISCEETKLKCKLNFKKMDAGRRGDVDGQVLNDHGKVLQSVYGNWTDSFFVGSPDKPTRIWQLAEMPKDYERYYGFTRFSLALNEIRPNIHGVLPPTDSRFRPDQRALEVGKVDEAEKLKRDLEEKQRARRKVNEAEKRSHTPLWFRATGNTDPAAGPRWEFTGAYWQAKKKQFKHIEFVDLW